jgi:hypothetical protein
MMRKETKKPVVQALLMKKGGSNPLKTFNDNRAAAYKKAGGAMKAFNKYLKKAQDGLYQGPLTEDVNAKLERYYNSDIEKAKRMGLSANFNRPALNKIAYEESYRTEPNLGASQSQKKKGGAVNAKIKKPITKKIK